MPDQVTLVSTTDSLEDVMRAMGQSVVTDNRSGAAGTITAKQLFGHVEVAVAPGS